MESSIDIPNPEAEEEVRRPFLLPWDVKLSLSNDYER
jgi:hypothetical protein